MSIKKRGLVMERQFGYSYKLKTGKYALDKKKSRRLKRIDDLKDVGMIFVTLAVFAIVTYFVKQLDIFNNDAYSGLIYVGIIFYILYGIFAYLVMVTLSHKIENSTMIKIISANREDVIEGMNHVIEFSDGAYIPVYEFIDKKTTSLEEINININRQSEPIRLININSYYETDQAKIDISRRDYPEINEEALFEKLLSFSINNSDLEEIKKQREVDTTYQDLQERHTRALQENPDEKQSDLKQLEHVSQLLNNETSINWELQQQLLNEQKELVKR